MAQGLLIVHKSGWVGDSGHRPVPQKTEPVQLLLPASIEVNEQTVKIQEADWHRAGLLMPMFVRELMRRCEEVS